MTDEEKTAVAVKSFQEFEALLETIRDAAHEQGYSAGYTDGHADALREAAPFKLFPVPAAEPVQA